MYMYVYVRNFGTYIYICQTVWTQMEQDYFNTASCAGRKTGGWDTGLQRSPNDSAARKYFPLFAANLLGFFFN